MQRLTMRKGKTIELTAMPGKACGLMCKGYTCNGCHVNDAFNKLADYEDAEEKGMLLYLPCCIGATVYVIVEDRLTSTMEKVVVDNHEYHRHIPNYFVRWDVFSTSMLDKIGKTVFLSKEEAEKALKQMGE